MKFIPLTKGVWRSLRDSAKLPVGRLHSFLPVPNLSYSTMKLAKRTALSLFAAFLLIAPLAARADAGAPGATMKVNRTLPQVQPPKTALEFSATPTVQEI